MPLFHCVDLDYTGSGYSFIYSDDVAEEAECVVNTLATYIQHFFPEATSYLESFFDEEALDRCKSLVFDPIQNEVIDTDVLEAVEIDVDEALQGFQFNKQTGSESASESSDDNSSKSTQDGGRKARKKKALRLGDEDSISTFGGRSKVTITSPPRRKTAKSSKVFRKDDNSVISGMSSSTIESIKTLREETNQKFDTLRQENAEIRGQNKDLQAQLSQLCALMQRNNSTAEATQRVSSPSVGTMEAGERNNSSSGGELL